MSTQFWIEELVLNGFSTVDTFNYLQAKGCNSFVTVVTKLVTVLFSILYSSSFLK